MQSLPKSMACYAIIIDLGWTGQLPILPLWTLSIEQANLPLLLLFSYPKAPSDSFSSLCECGVDNRELLRPTWIDFLWCRAVVDFPPFGSFYLQADGKRGIFNSRLPRRRDFVTTSSRSSVVVLPVATRWLWLHRKYEHFCWAHKKSARVKWLTPLIGNAHQRLREGGSRVFSLQKERKKEQEESFLQWNIRFH